MGRAYAYECPRCGYRTNVAGGRAEGYQYITQTVQCDDCRELYDVVTQAKLAKVPAFLQGPGMRGTWRPWMVDSFRGHLFALAPDNLNLSNLDYPKSSGGGHGRRNWISIQPNCPQSRYHQIRQWDAPGRCPRCGDYLERSLLPYRVWD